MSKFLAAALLFGALMLTSCAWDEHGNRRPLTDDERIALVVMLVL